MALQDLIARLEADAEAQVDAIARRADEEVRAIESAAAAQAAHELEAVRARRRAERLHEYEQAEALARRRARATELAARHELLDRVFARARDLLPELESAAGFAQALTRHAKEALSFLGAEAPARLRCNATTAHVLDPVAADRRAPTTIAIDSRVGPGVIAELLDGRVVVDNTLAARLDRLAPQLAIEWAAEAGS